MVWYLGGYCLAAWLICVNLPSKKPPLVPQTAPKAAQFFAGMKIDPS